MAQALKLAERIHHGVGSTPVRVHGGAHVTVTLSVGLATARPQPRSKDYKALAEGLIAEADAALSRQERRTKPGRDVDPRDRPRPLRSVFGPLERRWLDKEHRHT